MVLVCVCWRVSNNIRSERSNKSAGVCKKDESDTCMTKGTSRKSCRSLSLLCNPPAFTRELNLCHLQRNCKVVSLVTHIFSHTIQWAPNVWDQTISEMLLQFYITYFGIGLGDISHEICMRISSVKPAPWLAVKLHHLFSNGAAFNTQSRRSLTSDAISRSYRRRFICDNESDIASELNR